MTKRFKEITINEAKFMFDLIYEEANDLDPDAPYAHAFGDWIMIQFARDTELTPITSKLFN
jgi:GDP-D-mannose dehydratase